MAHIAVLGLGAMGSPMAANLLKAGHLVTVWNRSQAKTGPLADMGAAVAGTPRTAVANADFVVSMVRDDQACEAVWLAPDTGALAGMRPGAVGIESSTLTVACVRRLAERFRLAGRDFLDAPVAGSRPQADAAQLIYFIGGDAEILAKAEPVLQTMGGALHHAGRAGDGAALKLAVNALFGIQVTAMAEILGLLTKAGLDVAHAAQIIGATPVCSPAAKGAAASMLSGAFPAMFPVDLVEKDFGYVRSSAVSLGADMPVTDAAGEVFRTAIARGLGEDNLTGVVRLYR